ncbi:MAG TPA: ABC transporter ATP-binding protein [Bacteroidales bacterium]|nr:ABC transporter ATP-binding protein [Bacteroidales bacterium]
MSNIAISLENVSKQYRLGVVGTSTLRDDITRLWAKIRGLEDPTLKIGQENVLENQTEQKYIWALKDICFNVEQGEVLGIIGKNGAGKSTLLKLLSKVTTPTIGKIKIKGRIASLLEVGTGFHPELTGRENVFLNGAILGMSKSEIKAKFDEIVEFSGIGKYIDTPVKRYSSGMYVRLAFAVAAHLEPEILVVDEVLAVGDVDFQKRALGKMGEVSKNDGRTILFVSHNMTAIQTLCSRAVLLSKGQIVEIGKVDNVVNSYLKKETNQSLKLVWNDNNNCPGNEYFSLKSAKIIPENNSPVITVETPLSVEFEFINYTPEYNINLSLHLLNAYGEKVFNVLTPSIKLEKQEYFYAKCKIPGNFLNDGFYTIELMFVKDVSEVLLHIKDLLSFEVNDIPREGLWVGKWEGAVRPKLYFKIYKKN